MKITALALIFTVAVGAWDLGLEACGEPLQAQESSAWRSVAQAIPLGSKVRVQTMDGKRLSGTLMRADSSSMLIKRNTRHPEPAVSIAFDDVAKIGPMAM